MSILNHQGLLGRRDFLRLGVLGTTGLTLAHYLQASAMAGGAAGKAKSAIFIHLAGGPSHLDTFDPKPEGASEIKGEFGTIETKTAGLRISDQLPRLAKCSDLYSVLRGVSHNLAAHDLGQNYVLSGNRPTAGLEFPSMGAVATKELTIDRDLPPYVAIPRANVGPGYLGVAYGAFDTNAAPKAGQPFVVRGLTAPGGSTTKTVSRRHQLLKTLDQRFGSFQTEDQLLAGLDQFSQKAYDILQSSRTRDAFDMTKEPAAIHQRFGKTSLGMSSLLAVRLVEAGIRFVTVTDGGWDTHQDNFNRLKDKQLPGLDEGVSALLTTLAERGLLKSTAVIVTGEFGRTPKINKDTGRDHWPRAMFMLVAGGGMQPGQVIGSSDEGGAGPKDTDITPDDVVATLFTTLGIDPTKEYHTPIGRPVMIVREGTPIKQLIG